MMRSILSAFLLLLLVPASFAADKGDVEKADSLQAAFEQTIAVAQQAINTYGVTDSAMARIQAALAKLAAMPSLKERAKLQHLHGSAGANAALLASKGNDSISLFVARFDTGQATPVHDHLTWGVVHVLEGHDHYSSWEPKYGDKDSSKAEIRITKELDLAPGSSVYWFGPPHDLHSQEARGETVWELVLAGKNLLGASVLDHRHYFDPKTGRVTHAVPK